MNIGLLSCVFPACVLLLQAKEAIDIMIHFRKKSKVAKAVFKKLRMFGS